MQQSSFADDSQGNRYVAEKNLSQFANNSKVYKRRDLISAKFTNVIPNKVCIWKLNSILWKSSQRRIETFVKKFSGKHYAQLCAFLAVKDYQSDVMASSFLKNIHWLIFSFTWSVFSGASEAAFKPAKFVLAPGHPRKS